MLSLRVMRISRPFLRFFSTLPEHKEIIMPKVSPTMTAGRLISWKKKEGEFFEEGEDIADVESDKATMPISAREDGYMARIVVDEDTPDIPLGTILAVTVEEEHFLPHFKHYVAPVAPGPEASEEKQGRAMEKAALIALDVAPIGGGGGGGNAAYEGPIGPAIARLINEFPMLQLGGIAPTGKNGRMLKGDVLAAIEGGTAFGNKERVKKDVKVEEAGVGLVGGGRVGYTDVAVSAMRKAIARRLVASKTGVPHRYASKAYTLDMLLAFRKRLNGGNEGLKVSVNDLMLKAIGVAMRRVPEMNVKWVEGVGLVDNGSVDVSMAVAIEGGLITPIVTDVDRKGLREIAEMTKDLVERARQGNLEPEEFEGGGFSLSNLGMFGIPRFSAIINPPQSGILAVGSGVAKAVMGEDGKLSSATEGIATLSTDGRAIEEETAAEFLQEFSKCMSNPEYILL